jgi:hypothetical protein
MLMGMSWYAVAVGWVLLVSMFTLLRRRNEGATDFGEPGAQAVKLGRLY